MLYECGVNDNQIIIIFWLPDIVRDFAASQVYYYDRNFGVPPWVFIHVFVMRFKNLEDDNTRLYAFLINKTRQT